MYSQRAGNSPPGNRGDRFNFSHEQRFTPASSPRPSMNLQIPTRSNVTSGISNRLHTSTPQIQSQTPPQNHHPSPVVKPFVMPDLRLDHAHMQHRQAMDVVAPQQHNNTSQPVGTSVVAAPVLPNTSSPPAAIPSPSENSSQSAPQPVSSTIDQTDVPQISPPQASPNDTIPSDTSTQIDSPKKKHSLSTLSKILRSFGVIGLFIGVVIGGAAMLNAFVFQSYYVDGLSMQPALHDSDRLIVSKVERTAAEAAGKAYIPKRGQIVVIDSTTPLIDRSSSERIIKRVIGLPGETVFIHNGTVTVINKDNPNGLNVDALLGLDVEPTFSTEDITVTIPENSVFVLGDNRAEGGSYDSRIFGPINTELIAGRLAMRILPISDVSVF
jgi:signal peptidase I